MPVLEGFDAEIRDQFLSLDPDEDALGALAETLEIEAADDAEQLVTTALERFKGPNLLHALARQWPDRSEPGTLLDRWESDANLQDDWTESASARDLQKAKAYYVLADRSGQGDPKRVGRLLRKISRALADHPDNTSGDYEIYGPVRATDLLGDGEMATVYRGVHLETDETVAVKVLKASAAANPQLVGVLVNATERLLGVQHPQIARVREPVRPDDRPRSRPFYVLEYTDGGTLEDRIGEEGFSRPERQRAAVRLCQGLAYAHRRGLVHGNLKPSNVLMTSGHETRLSDFLVATGDEGSAVEVVKRYASPYYTGPEVVGGQTPSTESDIFSLGRLLFRLFTGKAENLYEVMVPQTFKLALEAQLSDFPGLIAIIERCTALEPADRPADVAEILAELHRFGGRLGLGRDEAVIELRSSGDWEGLITAQQSALLALPSEEQVRVLEEVASLQEYVLGDVQGALEGWAQAFRTEAGPRDGTIEAELDRLRGDLGTAEAARVEAEAITAVLDWGQIDSDDEVLRLKLKAAQLFHHEVDDNQAAIPLYNDALGLDARNEVAYKALDTLYQTEGDWPGLVALLERRLQSRTEDAEREELLQRIARTQEEPVGDLEASAESWVRLRNLQPRHDGAFANLDRLYRALERWDDLAALLEDEIAHRDDPDRLVELRYSLAHVFETYLERPADAIALYRTILAGEAAHPPTVSALEGLMAAQVEALSAAQLLEPIYRRRDEKSKLATALEVLVLAIDSSEARWVETLQEIAAIREDHEGALDAAFEVFARLHRGRPELTWAWDELERLAPKCAEPRWDEAVQIYGETIAAKSAEASPDAEFIIAMWQRVGEIEVQYRYDFEAAIRAYSAVLALSPRHEDALSKLELLFDETERWIELIDVLDTQKQVAFEQEKLDVGVGLMHRISALYEEQLGDADRGIQTYAAALSIDPADEVSVAQLERLSHDPAHTATVVDILDPHYTGFEDWPNLLALLERGLCSVADLPAPERSDALVRMASVAETKQGELEPAFDYFVRAVRADVERDATHAELERVAGAIGAWDRLVAFYGELLEGERPLSDERRQSMLFGMAGWQRDRLDRLDDAERSFRAVLAIDPDHAGTLDALDDLHTLRRQYPQLYEVLAQKARLALDETDKKSVLFRMANLCDEQLNDLDGAVEAYNRIVAIGEPDSLALDGLGDIYERRADYPRLLETLQQRAAVEPDTADRIDLLVRIGELARDELGERSTALSAFERALTLTPADPHPILEALAALYLAGDDLDAWYTILPARLEHADSDAERVARHLEAAELAVRSDAPETAAPTGHYEAVLRFDPYRPDVLLALETIYAAESRWSAIEDVYRRQFIGIHLKAAALAAEQMGDRAKAIEHLREASRLDPDRIAILDRLRALYEATGAWEDVVAIVERKLSLLDDPAAQGALLKALAAALENNGERERALDATLGAIELDPSDAEVLARLGRLAVLENRVGDLLPDVVSRIREGGAPSQMGPLLEGLDLLVAGEAAIAGGNTERATELLTESLAVEGLSAELALALMKPLFEHHGARAAMIGALAGFIQKPGDDPERRRAIFAATAQLSEAEGDLEAAYDLYGFYFEEQPSQANARTEMLRLAEALDRRGDAVDRIEARLEEGLDDDGLAIELRLMLGRVFEGGESFAVQTDRAIAQYRHVLELAPDQPEALEALDLLYNSIELWPGLRDVLARRVAIAEGDARQELSLRLAALIEAHFDEPEAVAEIAIEVISSAAEARETRAAARRFLETIAETQATPDNALFYRVAEVLEAQYAATKQRSALIALIEKEIALLPDDAAVSRRYDHLVALSRAAGEADQTEKALVTTAQALKLWPGDPELFEELERLNERVGDWEGIVTLYLELLAREELSADQSLQLALRAAHWLESELERPEDAAEAYRFAIEIEETQPEALAALERLYTELARMDDLYDLLIVRAGQSDEPTRRQQLERAAALANDELGRPEAAIACYRRILDELGPDRALLERLRALYLEMSDYEPLYEIMGLQLSEMEADDPGGAGALRLALGELAWAQLGDADRAIPHLSGALADESTQDEALTLLATVYEATGLWTELVDRLQTQLPLTASAEVRLSLGIRGARVAEQQLGDLAAAVALYEEVREVEPDHEEATASLYRLLEEAGQWADLLANLETDLGRVDDPDAQVTLSLRVAELARSPEKLDDSALATHYLGVALEIDPSNLPATRMLVETLLDNEEAQEAVALIGRVLAETEDDASRLELLLTRGDIFLEQIDLEDAAGRDFNEAFQLDPTSSPAADRLAELLTRQEAWSDLLSLYAQLVGRLDDVGEKVQVALKVAELVGQYDLSRDPLIEVLESTLQGDPPYPLNVQLILKLISAYQDVGNLPAASAYIERGLRDENGASNRAFQAELWYFKGLIAQSEGASDVALEAHETSYQLNNGHVPNLIMLSRLLYEAERWDDAVRILQVALLKQAALSPEQKVDVYYMMGMAWVNKGDRRRARDMFNRVLGLNREHHPTIEALEELE